MIPTITLAMVEVVKWMDVEGVNQLPPFTSKGLSSNILFETISLAHHAILVEVDI
jgi:hypothetical protein